MSLRFLSPPNLKPRATPPPNASDGDFWLANISTVGFWLLVRDAAGDASHPWKFLGGPDLASELHAGVVAGWGAGEHDIDGLPYLRIPYSGVWSCEFGLHVYASPCDGAGITLYRCDGNGIPVQSMDSDNVPGPAQYYAPLRAQHGGFAINANDMFKAMYWTIGANPSASWRARWMYARPVRLS